MMWKFLFFALVVWLIVAFFKRKLQERGMRGNHSRTKTEDMVQCSTCAVHLPRSEAFLVAGQFYCSQAHIKSK